ncbi:Hypothetical predicted protein [Olea europaea subsp. europaea]|uniref:FZ domain-containing protein n=1 Tax=Olea europaea subsp. europaea TaxID=158383 RepID=A0A8S0TSC1_OLEEU|nr:Hypothetical predicted protein [Olea europaea subsp. europaea]
MCCLYVPASFTWTTLGAAFSTHIPCCLRGPEILNLCAFSSDMAFTPFCLRVLENQGSSLPWQGCVPDMACKSCPSNCPEIPKNIVVSLPRPGHLHPYRGHDASQTWPAHCDPETIQKCLKIRLYPCRILYMACTSCPRSCLEMLENQAASLLRSGRVMDMAYTPCTRSYPEMPGNVPASLTWPAHRVAFMCLKIYLRPCLGQDASYTWPAHSVPKTTQKCLGTMLLVHGQHTVSQKCLKIMLRPYRVLDIFCTPCPRSYLEMPENQVASLLQPGCVLDMANTPYPRNCLEMPRNVPAFLTWPIHRAAFVCLKISLRPRCGLDTSWTWPAYRMP